MWWTPRGNSMTYVYAKIVGVCGAEQQHQCAARTTIDAKLDHIDYGTRAGSEASRSAPMQVWFTRTGRCINTCRAEHHRLSGHAVGLVLLVVDDRVRT